jgi:hypothetical protein
VTFENGSYQVKLTGGTNNNLLDVLNPNSVSVIAFNSAGLQSVATGAGPSAAELVAAILAAAQATPIHADVKLMNGSTVYGTGQAGDAWRGAGV